MTLKKCPYCSEEIQEEATVCKHCKTDLVAKKQEEDKAQVEIGKQLFVGGSCAVLMLLFIIFLRFPGLFNLFKGSSSSSSSYSRTYESEAMACAEMKVKDKLKSPSSAYFPFGSKTVTHSGSSYTVTGHFEAENSFGAKIKSDYECSLEITNSSYCTGSCTIY